MPTPPQEWRAMWLQTQSHRHVPCPDCWDLHTHLCDERMAQAAAVSGCDAFVAAPRISASVSNGPSYSGTSAPISANSSPANCFFSSQKPAPPLVPVVFYVIIGEVLHRWALRVQHHVQKVLAPGCAARLVAGAPRLISSTHATHVGQLHGGLPTVLQNHSSQSVWVAMWCAVVCGQVRLQSAAAQCGYSQ